MNNHDSSQPLLVNEGKAARMLGVTRRVLRRLRARGEIVSHKIARQDLYSTEGLREFARRSTL